MKKYILTFILISFHTGYCQLGNSGLAFLKIDLSPRALGLGATYPLTQSEPAAIFHNPAILTLSRSTQIQFVQKYWFIDSKSEFLGFSSYHGNFHFALGINSFNVQNIELRTNPGPPDGTFNSRNASISFSTAYAYQNFGIGITTKFLYEKIYIHEANGFAFDFGAIYLPSDYIKFALSLNNLGKMNKLYNIASRLPINMQFIISSQLQLNDLKLKFYPVIQLYTLFDEKISNIHTGFETVYNNLISLRAGFQTGYESRNFSIGFGIIHNIFTIDYSYIPFRFDLGNSHAVSILIKL